MTSSPQQLLRPISSRLESYFQMSALLIIFLSISAWLWISVYGYILILWLLANRKAYAEHEISAFPEIAVIIPTLNEEHFILSKLRNLKLSDYPKDRMNIFVVDGGSSDRTTELVEKEIKRGEKIQLLHHVGSRGKSDQVGYALDNVIQDIIVVNDADSILKDSCIKELIRLLLFNPDVAATGATIEPDSPLLEERIHWKILNHIWWLEGAALSAGSICGVCYAFRREKVFIPDESIGAEDIHLALSASSQGHPVLSCRKAHAIETRVPQTTAEFLEFRRRRGSDYVSALKRFKKNRNTPAGFRIARFIRLWDFLVVPILGIGVVFMSLALLLTPDRIWLIPSFMGLAAPILIFIFASNIASGEKHRWFRLGWATCRLVILTIISMLGLYHRPTDQGAIGGRSS